MAHIHVATCTCTYHRLFEVVGSSVLILDFIQGSLNLEQVLRVAGGVLVSDDQLRGGRETLEIHSSASLRLETHGKH